MYGYFDAMIQMWGVFVELQCRVCVTSVTSSSYLRQVSTTFRAPIQDVRCLCVQYILVLHCYRLLSVFIQTAAAEAKTTNGRQECLRMASLQRPVGNSQLESFFPTCFLPHLPHPPTTFPHPPAPPPLPYFRFLPWRWK